MYISIFDTTIETFLLSSKHLEFEICGCGSTIPYIIFFILIFDYTVYYILYFDILLYRIVDLQQSLVHCRLPFHSTLIGDYKKNHYFKLNLVLYE